MLSCDFPKFSQMGKIFYALLPKNAISHQKGKNIQGGQESSSYFESLKGSKFDCYLTI